MRLLVGCRPCCKISTDEVFIPIPGSKVKVISYMSRPLIQLTPPPKAKDPRVRTMNYIEAVRSLPISFSEAELEPILREIKPKWYGKVRSLFIVLSDDMVKKKFRSRSKPIASGSGLASATAPDDVDDDDDDASMDESSPETQQSNVQPDRTDKSARSNKSDRTDRSNKSDRSSRDHSKSDRSRSSKGTSSRSEKRGPSPSAQQGPEKHRK